MKERVKIPLTKLINGKVFNPPLPNSLTNNEKPVRLAELKVSCSERKRLYLMIEFYSFILTNRIIQEKKNEVQLLFSLLRKKDKSKNRKTIQTWPFSREIITKTPESATVKVNEPILLSVCDTIILNGNASYILEVNRVSVSDGSSYDITKKSITGVVTECQ
ncbi:hypothetical protein IC620_15675 [Hazenella sp. IB182357]|uniref:Uncharacterized protein n=1 Tax=Polycladospora coralii TaxID=2771432 RepID=A0A926RVN3_9BACL|nr:hypothetical protein [Polycladospora coralii]MBD1373784.1 hypothetical protein [Polycladospora coralii]MBS7531564.1 hypothetical protein [Polycladospora coralii]